jgi:uncharacterized protein YbjT (DUF2867 family)
VNTGPVLVTGALGNVGGATVTALLAGGAQVRAAGLDADSFARRFPGGEAVRLDFRDPETFRSAVVGCPSMLLLRPPPIARVKPTLNRLIDVAGENGMSHVVFSSVQGADTYRVVPHHRVEEHLLLAVSAGQCCALVSSPRTSPTPTAWTYATTTVSLCPPRKVAWRLSTSRISARLRR